MYLRANIIEFVYSQGEIIEIIVHKKSIHKTKSEDLHITNSPVKIDRCGKLKLKAQVTTL